MKKIKRFFQKILVWLYITIHSFFIKISIALYRTEIDILRANPTIGDESGKKIQRHRSHNQLLEKFYAGQRDEKYVQDYYELLKKADKFKREATPYKYEVAAWKHTGGYYGKNEDFWGRQGNEHLGFFDGKHKHVGKTLKEVMEDEYKERKLDDDDYEILYIFNNKPVEVGLTKAFDTLKKTGNKTSVVDEFTKEVIETNEMEVLDLLNKSKQFKFPISAVRREGKEVLNKIEELTEFLHVKKIGFEYRVLEFFVPLKFKINEVETESSLFYEIINVDEVHVKDDYGEVKSFGLLKFEKRITHRNYEVLKFQGVEMEKINKY